jgi:hypothetical protein
MLVWIPAEEHFLRNFTSEKKNDRLKILESIRGGREVQKSLNLAYDSVNI